jgi:hypothetical protein
LEKAKQYRRNALECRALAAKARNERIQAELLMIAEAWERLATDYEKKAKE